MCAMLTADVDGRRFHYYRAGEQGTPLLMLVGFNTTAARWWPPLIDKLAARHMLIMPENRGVADGDDASGPFTLAELAEDVVRLLDALGVDKVHIYGPSMGGMIAQHLALNHPARVRSLTLACSSFGGLYHPETVNPSMDIVMRILQPPTGGQEEYIRSGLDIGFPQSFIDSAPAFIDAVVAHRLQFGALPPQLVERQFAAVNGHDTSSRLGELRMPTLVVTGDEDVLIPPENSHRIAGCIPHARLIEYTGCGHAFMEQECDRFAADLLGFLQEVEQSKSI
jgi:3-oxoadipate enol-lactonase